MPLIIELMPEIGTHSTSRVAGWFDLWFFIIAAALGLACWLVVTLWRWSPADAIRRAEKARDLAERRIRELEKSERDLDDRNRRP